MASDVLFVFAFVFLFIGGIELLDRTSFALIAFSSKHPPFPTWAGAALALSLVAAFSSTLGSRLGARVEPRLLERLVIVILVVAGVLTILYALDPALFGAFLG